MRLKSREQDLVNMFLTGFDATTLNTLFVFSSILRLENILTPFDEFHAEELLSPRQGQGYLSIYLDIHAERRSGVEVDKERIEDDLVFELELIKQVEVDIDYILMLVERYREKHGDGEDKEIRAEISHALDASPTLRDKRDLIEAFVDSVTINSQVDTEWERFVEERRKRELDQIISEDALRDEAARDQMREAFCDGILQESGTAITKALPPVSRFTPDHQREHKKERVLGRLRPFSDCFYSLGDN